MLLSLLLNGGTIGALVLIGAREVSEAVSAEVAIERPYELHVPTMPEAGSATPAKKAARPRAKATVTPTVPTVAPPVASAQEVPVVSAVTTDDGAADAGGDGDGPEDGDGTGTGPGTGDGNLGTGSGVRVVHWSEVQVKTRAVVRPSDYPAAAAALNLPDTRCVVRMTIDEAGRPGEVVVKTCPEVYRASAETVARRYRFYPLVGEGGRPVKAAFDLVLNFKASE